MCYHSQYFFPLRVAVAADRAVGLGTLYVSVYLLYFAAMCTTV